MPIVINFQRRFAPLVRSGEKRHTMRLRSSNTPKPGDARSLRTWTGLPYRSKQEILISEVVVTRVEPMSTWLYCGSLYVRINSVQLSDKQIVAFARADGFADAGDMWRWLEDNGRLPFKGVLIHW